MNWDLFERIKEVGAEFEERGLLVYKVIVFEEDSDVKARFVLYDDRVDIRELLSVGVAFTEVGVIDGNFLYVDVWFGG